jgi:hypothetical protein
MNLILDVLQHHLVVAQLYHQFSSQLLAALILLVKSAEFLAARRLTVLKLTLIILDVCLELSLQLVEADLESIIRFSQFFLQNCDFLVLACTLLTGLIFPVFLVIEFDDLLQILNLGDKLSFFYAESPNQRIQFFLESHVFCVELCLVVEVDFLLLSIESFEGVAIGVELGGGDLESLAFHLQIM